MSFSKEVIAFCKWNSGIREKLEICVEMLTKMDQLDSWGYHHVNVLVVCLEALALQDRTLTLRGGGTECDRNTVLGQVREALLETEVKFVKNLRTRVIHGIKSGKVQTPVLLSDEDFKNMFRESVLAEYSIPEIFEEIKSYVQETLSRIIDIQNQSADLLSRKSKLLDLFKPYHEISNALGRKVGKEEIIAELEKILGLSVDCGADKCPSIIVTEEIFYKFTVESFALIKSEPKLTKIVLLQTIREKRGELIHKFYESLLKSPKELSVHFRHFLLLQFLKQNKILLLKLLYAFKIYNELKSDGINQSKIQNIFDTLKPYADLAGNGQRSDTAFHEVAKDYILLMPILDDVIAQDKRKQDQVNYKKLSDFDRMEIYQDFLLLKSKYEEQGTDYEKLKNAAGIKYEHMGIAKTTFEKMVESFIVSKQLPAEMDPLLTKLMQLKKDFLWKGVETIQEVLKIIPSYRNLNVQIGDHYVEKLEHNVIGLFLEIYPPCEQGLMSVSELFGDVTFLECLSNLMGKHDHPLWNTMKDSYLAPLKAKLYLDDPNGKDCIQIILDLVASTRVFLTPPLIEILRSILHACHLSYQTINFEDLFEEQNSRIDFRGLIYVKYDLPWNAERKDGKRIERDNFLDKGLARNILDNVNKNMESVSVFARILATAAEDWWRYEPNKDESFQFLREIGRHSAFDVVRNPWNSVELILCETTLRSKQFQRSRTKPTECIKDLELTSRRILLSNPVLQDMKNLYKSAVEGNGMTGKLLRDSILLRCGFSSDIKFDRITYQQFIKTKEIKRIGIYDLDISGILNMKYEAEATNFSKESNLGLLSHEVLQDLKNLYDSAYNRSQLRNEHAMAYDIYKHMSESILLRCGCSSITTFNPDVFQRLAKTEEYIKLVEFLGHVNIMKIRRDMAFEQTELSKNEQDSERKMTHLLHGISLYKEVVEVEIACGIKENGTKTLIPFTKALIRLVNENENLPITQKVEHLEEAKVYTNAAIRISKEIYPKGHKAIKLQEAQLANIEARLSVL